MQQNTYINLLFLNAISEAVFKYFSKSNAFFYHQTHNIRLISKACIFFRNDVPFLVRQRRTKTGGPVAIDFEQLIKTILKSNINKDFYEASRGITKVLIDKQYNTRYNEKVLY